jgi:hypothetical protein
MVRGEHRPSAPPRGHASSSRCRESASHGMWLKLGQMLAATHPGSHGLTSSASGFCPRELSAAPPSATLGDVGSVELLYSDEDARYPASSFRKMSMMGRLQVQACKLEASIAGDPHVLQRNRPTTRF